LELTIKQTQALELLEDMTNGVTSVLYGGSAGSGKTHLACYWLLKNCLKYPGTRWAVCGAVLVTMKNSVLESFRDVCQSQGVNEDVHWQWNEGKSRITFTNGSQILLLQAVDEPSRPLLSRVQGIQLTGVVFDEAANITEQAYHMVMGRVRYKLKEYGIKGKALLTCNPSKGWLYNMFYQPKKKNILPDYLRFIQALPTDNPYLDEDAWLILSRLPYKDKIKLLDGVWEYEKDDNALIEYDNIVNIFSNTHVSKPDTTRYITADVARQGSDKAVIMLWYGLEVVEIKTFAKSSLTELQQYIIQLKTKHGVLTSNIIADEDGVGGGLIDNLRCKGFLNNSKALNDENYYNLKTQCYFKLAEYINAGKIYISAELGVKDKEDIIQELEEVKSKDSDGKVMMVSKDNVKEAIGRSPDYSDALMMRMWYECRPKVVHGSQKFR
jgi:hypothetical protein